MRTKSEPVISELGGSLEGQCLIAMPSISEGCFARSVVFMCAHSEEGAMGLIVNLPAPNVSFATLLEQLELIDEGSAASMPSAISHRTVYVGGPVATSRGFVLHTPDYYVSSSSVRVRSNICLTSTIDILKAIREGSGPEKALLALGYSGWGPGQLEDEFTENSWLSCAADPELIFDEDHTSKYDRALMKLGIASSHLSGEAGHA